MTKRNTRNRRHGTNEIVVDGRKGRTSPTGSNSENQEYTMIDLVRSVEKLHLCKRSGERKDTVLWADVKKHYKKHTGRVLSTEAFNKLAGVSGVSRKELIAGPLAGLLVAEDPAALVIRFKYDANKGDPLINHRFYLEAAGAKTSVHNAADAVSPRRLADLTNTVSPSRSDISSSLSPTCVSSISTDPDTDAFSPVSAASPLSSAPLSPETREYVTANDEVAASGEQSFLTARTSPITSDWDTSSSSRGASATPDLLHNRSNDQERTLNLLDVSAGPAETTIGAREVLVDMDAPVKEESKREEEKVVEREEEKKVKEDLFEEESDKENHVESQPAAKPQEVPAAATPVPAAPAAVPEAVAEQQKDDDVVIEVPEAVEEIVIETSPAEEEKTDDAIEQPVEEEEKLQPEHVAAVESVAEEVKGEQREEKESKEGQEEEQDPAAGDCPVPTSPIVEAAASLTLDEALLQAASPVTTSSSDETLLTVIERVHCGTVQLQEEEEEEEEEEKMHEEPTEIKLQQQLLQPEDTVEDMEVDDVEEKVVVVVEKKEEQLAAGDVPDAVAAVVGDSIEQPKEEEETVAVVDVVEAVAEKEEEERKEEKEEEVMREKREASRVEEDQQVESTPVEQPEDAARKEEEEEAVVDTVEKKIEAAPEVIAVPEAEDVPTVDTASDTTDEPTTMVAAASVAPLQQMLPVQQQPQPVLTQPEPQQPPLPTHEPMETISLNSYSSSSSSGSPRIDRPPSPTSDDVEMNDVLVGGPNTDVHTPSVTAPITLQPKPVSKAQPEDDTEVITSQPVDELDSAPAAAAASPSKEDTAATPDLALRRAAPAKKFPCCTIV